MKDKIKIIKEMHSLQKNEISENSSPYMVGLYNGLEATLAILESREPVYKDCVEKN